MEIKFSKGDYVKYRSNGVCLIENIGVPDFATDSKSEYYMLRPTASQNTLIFVPSDSEILVSRMRRILTKDEIDNVIADVKNDNIEWPEGKKERLSYFQSILLSDQPVELLRLASCIHIKSGELEKNGKKLLSADVNALEQAEKLVENEFSFVLGINASEVSEYIRSKIEQ